MGSIFLTGPQALIVSSALDPDVFLDALAARGFNPKLWTAKLTGVDTGGRAEIEHGFARAKARGLHVGGWVQCGADPLADLASVQEWLPQLEYMEWCCEIEYKGNPPYGENASRADQLVAATAGVTVPQAVITYGRLDTYMRMGVFAEAGWHVCPEAYDGFTLSEADTYRPTFLGRRIHPLQRLIPPDRYLGNRCGVYRPEGLL